MGDKLYWKCSFLTCWPGFFLFFKKSIVCDAFALRPFAPPISPFALNILWQWLFDQENKQNYSHWLFLPCKAEIIFLLTCVFPWSIKLFKNKDFCLYFVVKHLWTRKLPSWKKSRCCLTKQEFSNTDTAKSCLWIHTHK